MGGGGMAGKIFRAAKYFKAENTVLKKNWGGGQHAFPQPSGSYGTVISTLI